MGARLSLFLLGAQYAVARAELAHLRDGVLLHLLQLLLLLAGHLQPSTLHQDELCEELCLLEQEVEFLSTTHLCRGSLGGGSLALPSGRRSSLGLLGPAIVRD